MAVFLLSVLTLLHRCANFFSRLIEKVFPALYRKWNQLDLVYQESKRQTVQHNLNGTILNFSFYTPNALTRYRADTFSTKEPETLQWIDKYANKDDVFFDIGANVGLYSIYYAKTKQGITYSFEPSVFNLKLLVKNVNLNHCQDRIRLLCNPLSNSVSFADFNLQNMVEGGALSSFGVDYGHDGKKLDTQVSYQTLGFSLDYLIEHKIISDIPALIKVDVDGIEHLILRGAGKVLTNPVCRSILIEVNDGFAELASEVNSILNDAGFILLEKVAADAELQVPGSFTYNQIWVKQLIKN